MIRFFARGQLQGYLATDGVSMYTNAPGLEAARKTTREEVAAFLAAIPAHAKR